MMKLRLDTRAVEALLTVFMINIGMVYLVPGETFVEGAYHFERSYMVIRDEFVGFALILFGGFRWTAVLFTNGGGPMLYYTRIATAFISGLNWLIIAIITWSMTEALAILFTVASSCIIFEVFSIYRAFRDYQTETAVVIVEKDALR